jgi:hypothetical protein
LKYRFHPGKTSFRFSKAINRSLVVTVVGFVPGCLLVSAMVFVSHGFPVDQMGGDDDRSRNGYDDDACFSL